MLTPEGCCYKQVNSYFLILLNHGKHPFCQNFFADSTGCEEGIHLFILHLLPLHVHKALTHKQHSIIPLLILPWELHWADPQASEMGNIALCLDGRFLFLLCYITFHNCSCCMLRKHRVLCPLLFFVIHSLTQHVLLDKHNCRNTAVLFQCNYFLLIEFAS